MWVSLRITHNILCIFFFFFFIFSHFYVGSMCLVRRLHLDRSCASSSDNPLSDKSFLMLSIHLRFGLPLLLFPGTSIPNTLFPTYSSSLYVYHGLIGLTFSHLHGISCGYTFHVLRYIHSYLDCFGKWMSQAGT